MRNSPRKYAALMAITMTFAGTAYFLRPLDLVGQVGDAPSVSSDSKLQRQRAIDSYDSTTTITAPSYAVSSTYSLPSLSAPGVSSVSSQGSSSSVASTGSSSSYVFVSLPAKGKKCGDVKKRTIKIDPLMMGDAVPDSGNQPTVIKTCEAKTGLSPAWSLTVYLVMKELENLCRSEKSVDGCESCIPFVKPNPKGFPSEWKYDVKEEGEGDAKRCVATFTLDAACCCDDGNTSSSNSY